MAGAPARFDLSVLGDKQLEVALRALPAKIERRLLRTSLRKAFKRTFDAAKAAVPVEVGALKRSLKLRAGRGGRGLLQFRIFTGDMAQLATLGARRTRKLGARGAKREGYYPAAVELGYARRTAKGLVRVPARSFLRAALASTRDAVIQDVATDLKEGIREIAAETPGGSA